MAVKPLQGVPKELEFLLPEKVSKPILIGDSAYDLFPLTEGEFEKLSMEVSKLFDAVFVKQEFSPIGYLLQKDVLVSFLSEALKPLSNEEIKAKLTAKQMVYIASVVWQMNFETGDFSDDVKENFRKVLGWMGLAALAPAPNPAPAQTEMEA